MYAIRSYYADLEAVYGDTGTAREQPVSESRSEKTPAGRTSEIEMPYYDNLQQD